MNPPLGILEQNRRARIAPHPAILLMWGLFSSWQMGVVYFSGSALSVDGRVPLPFEPVGITAVIAAGYAASIIFLIFLPQHSLTAVRTALCVSLSAVAALLLDLPPAVQAAAFCVEAFCCVFMIGATMSVIILWFDPRSEFIDVALTMITSGVFIAVVQSDLFELSFFAFNIVSLILNALMLTAAFLLKVDRSVRFSVRSDSVRRPKRLGFGIYLLVFVSCLMTLFGTGIAEMTEHGVSVMYIVVLLCGVVMLLLYKYKVFNPLESGSILTVVAALGFLFSLLANYFPPLRLLSCALLGCGIAVCLFASLLGVFLFGRSASRYITPMIVFIGFVTAMLHSLLLELLRGDHFMLTVVLFAVAMLFVLIFMTVLPYLSFLWNSEISAMERESAPPVGKASARTKPAAATVFDELSGQERRLAELILAGYSGQEIADNMNITVGTMKNYRINLYTKLDIHSRRELFELYGQSRKQ